MSEWHHISSFDERAHGGLFDATPVEVADDEGNIAHAVYAYEDEGYDDETGEEWLWGTWYAYSPDIPWYSSQLLDFYPTKWRLIEP